MADQAKKNFENADALKAISLDDLSEGGLDALWGRLKSLATIEQPTERPNGASRRTQAEDALQEAEQQAMQATQAVFDRARAEAEEELVTAQRVKAAAIEAQQQAEQTLARAGEIKAVAQQQSEELIAEAHDRAAGIISEAQDQADADAGKTLMEAQGQASTIVTDAEADASRIKADAEAKAEEILGSARAEFEKELESLRADAIEEIRSVKDGIERLRAELQDELETQRILTNVARTKAVAHLVGGTVKDAPAPTGPRPGDAHEDEAPAGAEDAPEVFEGLDREDANENVTMMAVEDQADSDEAPEEVGATEG